MVRRLIVSDGEVSRQISTYKVAVGGVVKSIQKAFVAENGVVRQYYPYGTPDEWKDPRITWDEDALTVNQVAVEPADSFATITFNREFGSYSYNDYPNPDGVGLYLNPPLDGTGADDGKYIIKVDQISGTALTGTLGSWVDMNSAASLAWSLDQTVPGTSTAVADITIATDNGAGSPVAGTSVVKQVTFNSTVTDGDIPWSSVQRDLVEVKTAVNANCDLIFSPDGTAVGEADTSGAFSESWHPDAPTATDPESYTVQVDVISGQTPAGDATGSAITLDVERRWTLETDGDEDISCELDVTVSDGVNSITKRVTKNSVRDSGDVPPKELDAEWCDNTTLKAVHWNNGRVTADLSSCWLRLYVNPDGTILLEKSDNTPETDDSVVSTLQTDTWHPDAPSVGNPGNYEVRLFQAGTWFPRVDYGDIADVPWRHFHREPGQAGYTEQPFYGWLPLDQQRKWMWGSYAGFNPVGYWKPTSSGDFYNWVPYKRHTTSEIKAWLEIRKIGGIEVRTRLCMKWVWRG